MNIPHSLNLHLLRIFAAVVEQQSFSRAAEILFITQSAVSKAVRELEHQLDLPLIDRGPGGSRGVRGVRLTEGGQALFEHARGIFAMERIALEDVRERVGLRKGGLRIGASTTVAGYWLPAHIAAFARRHPDIAVELVVANTAQIAEAIINCEVDAAIVEGPVEDPRIDTRIWREEALVIIAPEDMGKAGSRRTTAAALSEQTWLLREPGSGTRRVAQEVLRSHGITPRQQLAIGSNEAIARAVAAGAGVALLPSVVVEDLIAMRRVRALTMDQQVLFTRPLYQLELLNRRRSPALQAFLDDLPGSGTV
ncbi:LysR substrate-binding domain-containing protein [Pseudoxanthomonas indica]|uniref:DNA-binding transcriptional regulator, LysR family n=1 Tax=Pseudoxanthomonas indica TaxID=428993 RepID=A0A1T5L9E4_9GAMM|nr:LysR substrate-binding domain-containing protein [Pseudoxanthomonas indica]GGD32378.1 LysR family transcriptional regulator [Pseudoxanthomonas indica]SKC72666.1 DNA-binding transcriptional regulator, LysR family [Pseudoxanthomonas indica]